MAELSRDEFLEHMSLLRDDVKGVHARLDTLNGRTRTVESAVAVLQDRSAEAKNSGAKAGGAIGAAAAALVSGLWQLFGK